jgi:hypothetical protein
MAVVDHIVIRDKTTGVLKDREITADAENVLFKDEENLVTKYNEIYDIIPTKTDGTKGFGTGAVEDLFTAEYIPGQGTVEKGKVISGNFAFLLNVIETDTPPTEESRYTPRSLVIVVP